MGHFSTYLFSAFQSATATSGDTLYSSSVLPLSFYQASNNTGSFNLPLLRSSIFEICEFDIVLISIIILTLPFAIVYLITWALFTIGQQDGNLPKVPSTIPYMVPYFGSVLTIGLDPIRFVSNISSQVQNRTAYAIKILGRTVYLIQGPENISQLWKYKTTITSPTYVFFLLRNVFGMDLKAAKIYSQDDSGIHQMPTPQSKVAAHNRVDYFTHRSFAKYLGGNEHMTRLFNRFGKAFANRVEALGINGDWSQESDLFEFWTAPLTASLIEASSGPLLECVNPNFARDFNEFLPYIHPLVKGLPRWWIPRAYELRESLTRDVLQWQAIARARFQESDVDSDGDADPWWGSQFIRERQKFFSTVDGWDYDAIARSDLGLIWGFALNLHPATIWTIVEVFKDEKLLQRVRKELAEANFTSANTKDDVDRLLNLPLLQSIYAEVLRLRVEVYHLFHTKHVNIELKQWNIPKNNLAAIETRAAHRNEDFWNTRNGQYPLDTFWAERFLVYPGDPLSGPMKKNTNVYAPSVPGARDVGNPKFKDSGIADSFIPYGIGERTCPGRFFAKRAIISFCATIVNDFDIELLVKKEHYPSSTIFWGTGTQRPADKIAFKIRRRSVKAVEQNSP